MRKKTALVCALVAAAPVGCSLISLDDLAGPGDASVDGAIDASEAGLDATSDVKDATSPPDAPLDGVTNPTSFCASVDAGFCDDFDDSDASTFTHWTSSSMLHGATITRDSSDASTPFGARFAASTSDAGTPVAILKKVFSTPITSSATLSFDVRVDEWPTPATAALNTAQVTLAGASSIVSLRLRQANSQLEETVATDAGNTFPVFALSQSPVLGQWLHVEMDFTLVQSVVNVTVRFDGGVVLAQTPLDPSFTFGVPTMFAGEIFLDPGNQSTSLLVDDVVFSYQ